MGKQSKKERQPAKESDKMNEAEDQNVSNDRSYRHISEIDCREGEMEHGETGGFKERPISPDSDERA